MILLLFTATFLILLLWSPGDTNAFQLPKIKFVGLSNTRAENDLNAPQILIQKGPEDTDKLRQNLEKYCTDASSIDKDTTTFRWEPHLYESYEVANAIFEEVARVSREGYNDNEKQLRIFLSFPSMKRPADLENLSQVLQSNKCKQMLGLDDVCAELYPISPAPYLSLTFATHDNAEREGVNCQDVSIVEEDDTSADSAISATKDWVNNFLGKYRLCPYTSSISRAAVGLSSVDVPVGGVHIVDTGTAINTIVEQDAITRATATKLVSAFWSEVNLLMKSTEEEWATSLVLCPEYDADFESFADICDTVIEPTVLATRSTDVIGRAWFHPLYNADAIGHSGVIGGHAVPHKMVYGFMKTLHSSSNANDDLLEYDELAMANDKVRQTPHATINILRRSQLNAAAEYEKGLGEKRPKANSIYVRNVRRISDVMRSSNNNNNL